MVELQSFYHHHFHHSQQENASKTTRPPTSGNYALPYDVLPVSRENSNVAIYGQRPVTAVNAQSQSVPSSQQPSVAEPLYATTKPVASYNHYCQKVSAALLFTNMFTFVLCSWMTHNRAIQAPIATILPVEPTTNH